MGAWYSTHPKKVTLGEGNLHRKFILDTALGLHLKMSKLRSLLVEIYKINYGLK
jgi:hypothetical protein